MVINRFKNVPKSAVAIYFVYIMLQMQYLIFDCFYSSYINYNDWWGIQF